MRVDVCKKLEETMHVQVRHLSQDSFRTTFDLFKFLSKTQGAAYLRVRLIPRCLRYDDLVIRGTG